MLTCIHVFCLEKSITGFRVEIVIVFPLFFAYVQYTQTDTIRQHPAPIVLFRTNGKLLSRLVYISCANCISLTLESRAKAFVVSFYFLTFFMESLESAFPAVSNRRNVIKSRNVGHVITKKFFL